MNPHLTITTGFNMAQTYRFPILNPPLPVNHWPTDRPTSPFDLEMGFWFGAWQHLDCSCTLCPLTICAHLHIAHLSVRKMLCFLEVILFSLNDHYCYWFWLVSPLYCMDDSSHCEKLSSKKDLMELTIFPLSLVFQMQKECFSLPANKATITLFLYTNGKKVYL